MSGFHPKPPTPTAGVKPKLGPESLRQGPCVSNSLGQLVPSLPRSPTWARANSDQPQEMRSDAEVPSLSLTCESAFFAEAKLPVNPELIRPKVNDKSRI